MTLKELSRKATPGPWKVTDLKRLEYLGAEGPLFSYQVGNAASPDGMRVSLGSERVADHEFVAALVNAYRAGELVERHARPEGGAVPLPFTAAPVSDYMKGYKEGWNDCRAKALEPQPREEDNQA